MYLYCACVSACLHLRLNSIQIPFLCLSVPEYCLYMILILWLGHFLSRLPYQNYLQGVPSIPALAYIAMGMQGRSGGFNGFNAEIYWKSGGDLQKWVDGVNNLLTETKTLTPQILSTEIITEDGTRYYDADGNLVSEEVNSSTSETVVRNLDDLDAQALEIVNNKGTTLPETGGIGTTIFYIVGAVLVLGAGVILFVRRRMIHEK